MRVLRCCLILGLVACGGPEPPVPSTPTPAGGGSDAAVPVPDAAVSARASTAAMLAAKGYTIEAVDADGTLVCSASECVCLVDLDCAGTGCITLDANLAAFKDALHGKDGAEVSCELADTGRLCDGSYFRFEGDIYRYEDRYFGPDGHLIGMKNSTDYTEYCHGRAMYQFAGTIPDCAQPATDVKVFCSEKGRNRPIGNPMEFLLWAVAR